jgi:hypothetical protein
MSQNSHPYTERDIVGIRRTNLRMLHCIDIHYQEARKKVGMSTPPEQVVSGLWDDPSQSCMRNTCRVRAPLLTQTNLPFSFQHATALSGRDALSLQGFPNEAWLVPPHLLSDQEARSLAGESFFLPVVTTLTYAFWLNHRGPWWDPASTQASDIEE